MRWPASSQAEISFAPSASSTRMPQTKSAARISFAAIAFRIRVLASCHFKTDPSLRVGSSSVSAICGRTASFGDIFDAAPRKESNARTAGGTICEQTAADPAFASVERNLRRFMATPSVERTHPILRPSDESLEGTGIGSGCSRCGARCSGGFILNGIELVGTRMEVEPLRFGAVERARAAATKNRELVSRFVDGTVPVNPFRNSERGTARVRSGNKFGRGPRAEAGEMRGVIPWRQDLQNAK